MNRFKPTKLSLSAAVIASLHRAAVRFDQAAFAYMQRTGLILCAAHTAAESFTDTIYAISATLPATYDAAGYGATTITYTTIGGVSDFPEFGSERALNKFSPIAGSVEKSKGSPDYGEGDAMMKDVPADAGQVILKAAEASANHYTIKITYVDGEIHYLDVLVASWRLAAAKEGAFLIRKAKIGLCRAPVVVAAS